MIARRGSAEMNKRENEYARKRRNAKTHKRENEGAEANIKNIIYVYNNVSKGPWAGERGNG